MSGGKKKSGFQITSVTSDYGQASMASQKSSFPGDSSGSPLQPQQPPAEKALTNGGQSMAPSLTSRQAAHAHSSSPGRVAVEGGEGMGETRAPSLDPAASSSGDIATAGLVGGGGGRVSNGPALLDPTIALHIHTSSSQPGTPVTKRKQVSQEHGGSHSSRFRVVRLGQGPGEPYHRGRWTCVDFLEREGGEERGLRRVLDSMRHAHSLESLETVGLGGFEGGGGGAILKPLGHIRALRSGHLVHSQGTTHLLAPHIGVDKGAPSKPFGEGPCKADLQKGSPAFKPQTFSSEPPSPTHKNHPILKLVGSPTFDPSVSYPPHAASPHARQDARRLSPTKLASASVRPRHIPSPLRLDMDTAGKSLLRETRSQPTSPSSILPRDRGFYQSTTPIQTPIQTPSALSLAQSMFGVGGAFQLGDGRSPKNGSQFPSARSSSPGSILTNPSPHSSPPLSRSSSAPSSPNLRRTACFSVSPASANVPPVILRSSHPNLHLASHKMPSGLHQTPPSPPSWSRHPVTPPPLPRQLRLPRGAERQREEGLGLGQAWVSVRSSWPSSRTELCSCGRPRCSEVTEGRSPCTSISCEKKGQPSCREPLPNPHTPGGPSVSHTQAAFGTAARGTPGERETSSTCFNRLKTPALPSPIPLTGSTATPRKQNQIRSPTLTRKYTLSVPSQPGTGPALPPVLKPHPYGTHSADPTIERDLATFTPIKTGGFCPPFLDSGQTQSRGLAVATVEPERATFLGSNLHQPQDHSGFPSLRAQGCYWNSGTVDTCDRQTQTQSHTQKDCDLIIRQTGSVGRSHVSKEVQTVSVCAAVNPIEINAPGPSQTLDLNSSGTNSTGDMAPNSESWAGPASRRHGENCCSGAFQAQDHNGNKVCLPSNVVNLGSLNSTMRSHDLKVGTSPGVSELSSSITCNQPTANPAASVTKAAVQGPFNPTATGTAIQPPVHTTVSRAALQGPIHTPTCEAALQGPIHTNVSRTALQGPIHTPPCGAQVPIHTPTCEAALQGPVHTTVSRAALQGPIHTPTCEAALQGPIHTTVSRTALQGPIHTPTCEAALQGPVHTTVSRAALQGPIHTPTCEAALQGPIHTTVSRTALQGPIHTPTCGAALQGPIHTPTCGAAIEGPIDTINTTVSRAVLQGPIHTPTCGAAVLGHVHNTTAVPGDIRGVPTPGLPKASEPFPHGAENTVHPSRVKPHMEGKEPKEPKPVPVTLTRNSDKAFLSLLLFIHSGSSNSMIAIDNKIEQAMDLVKTHLMMAVREEVEVLREQIKELSERNAQLERENYILRALRERD